MSQASAIWRLSNTRAIVLDRPRVMAIVNATPDSFSDGGVHLDPDVAAMAAVQFVGEGADVLDVGGESTRPGAPAVPADEQIARVVPVIKAIRARLHETPITIDTMDARVAAAALDAGADAINDVSGATADEEMLSLAGERGAGIVLMHRLTTPDRDCYSDRYASEPGYRDVVEEVRSFLAARAQAAVEAGVGRERIVLDPGLGFGKSVAQNLELMRRTGEIRALGYPVLSGASRKSFVGRASTGSGDSPASSRVFGSVGASVSHLAFGAMIFRVHDVSAQAQGLRMAWECGVGADMLAGPSARA